MLAGTPVRNGRISLEKLYGLHALAAGHYTHSHMMQKKLEFLISGILYAICILYHLIIDTGSAMKKMTNEEENLCDM